jgi:hypothetical protein
MQHVRQRNANLNQNFGYFLTLNGKNLICEGVILDTIRVDNKSVD